VTFLTTAPDAEEWNRIGPLQALSAQLCFTVNIFLIFTKEDLGRIFFIVFAGKEDLTHEMFANNRKISSTILVITIISS